MKKTANITDWEYAKLAHILSEQIAYKDYFDYVSDGTIELQFGIISGGYPEFLGQLQLKAVIYRGTATCDGQKWQYIRDVVPLWWEFHTITDGGECDNNFDFSKFKQFLIETE